MTLIITNVFSGHKFCIKVQPYLVLISHFVIILVYDYVVDTCLVIIFYFNCQLFGDVVVYCRINYGGLNYLTKILD